MLRFRLQQIRVASLDKYFLPLPKLWGQQLVTLSRHLKEKGFDVHPGRSANKLSAANASQRIAVDGRLGLASSASDMLDVLAPAIPSLLSSRDGAMKRPMVDVSSLYFAFKRSRSTAALQFFPRLESLRTWTCLRIEGLIGLTPDEALMLNLVFENAPIGLRVPCVTAFPREGSSPFQLGKRVYYKSKLPVREFLSSLKSFDSNGTGPTSYLPRNSIIELDGMKRSPAIDASQLGDWCAFG